MVFREELPTDLPTLPEWSSNIYAQHFLQLLAQFSFIKSGFFVHSWALAHSEQCLFLSLQPVGKNSNAIWVSRSKSRADQEESSHHPRKVIFIIDTQAMKQKHLQFEQLFQQLSSINFLFFLHSPSLAQSGQLVGCLSIQGAVREQH